MTGGAGVTDLKIRHYMGGMMQKKEDGVKPPLRRRSEEGTMYRAPTGRGEMVFEEVGTRRAEIRWGGPEPAGCRCYEEGPEWRGEGAPQRGGGMTDLKIRHYMGGMMQKEEGGVKPPLRRRSEEGTMYRAPTGRGEMVFEGVGTRRAKIRWGGPEPALRGSGSTGCRCYQKKAGGWDANRPFEAQGQQDAGVTRKGQGRWWCRGDSMRRREVGL